MCCQLNLFDSVIPATTHKLIKYYVRYSMYTYSLKKSWMCVYVFITLLIKITIKVRNHHSIAFHSKSLDMSHPYILYVNICSNNLLLLIVNNNNNNNK